MKLDENMGAPPLTQALIHQIHQIESGARPLDCENMRELGALP